MDDGMKITALWIVGVILLAGCTISFDLPHISGPSSTYYFYNYFGAQIGEYYNDSPFENHNQTQRIDSGTWGKVSGGEILWLGGRSINQSGYFLQGPYMAEQITGEPGGNVSIGDIVSVLGEQWVVTYVQENRIMLNHTSKPYGLWLTNGLRPISFDYNAGTNYTEMDWSVDLSVSAARLVIKNDAANNTLKLPMGTTMPIMTHLQSYKFGLWNVINGTNGTAPQAEYLVEKVDLTVS